MKSACHLVTYWVGAPLMHPAGAGAGAGDGVHARVQLGDGPLESCRRASECRSRSGAHDVGSSWARRSSSHGGL